jgi:two-component system, OmpR family, response regulator
VSSVLRPVSGPPPCVLFVDDDPDAREIASIQLASAGFDVVTAANSVEALALFDTLAVDVVVTDIFMPAEDGIELIQDVRAREPRFPIVAISGGSLRHLKALGVASTLGADALLEKPCGAGELVAAIRLVLEAAR